MKICKNLWGADCKGNLVSKYVLKNRNGMEVEVSDFGALIVGIRIPGENGKEYDVTLGYDTIEEYYNNDSCFGAYVGRNVNKIKNACVELDGAIYELEKNRGEDNIHSGSKRSYYEKYQAITGMNHFSAWVTFSRLSPHMEQGFPGNLNQLIKYTFTENNELIINYDMVSDMTTVINPTNHSYFNLSGHDSGDILNHHLKIYSDKFLASDKRFLPTGEIINVEDTAFDFRKEQRVGKMMEVEDSQIRITKGYNHNYIFDNDERLKRVAYLKSPDTNISMTVYTTMCGMQLYTANHLSGEKGKNSAKYNKYAGICFETQFYPNACNIPHFPSSIFKNGEHYISKTIYKFDFPIS